uniref:MIF4G domain-containing protein n=1 Tax=Macrostomum lignano TaxID=282301 RepID=A0A1I8JGY8_9PLAT
ELSLVEQSLLSVLSSAAQASIRAIFSQLSHPDLPEAARRRCIRFLSDRILCIDRCQMTPEVEEVIVEQVTTALEDVTEAEFTCFIKVLASLQCMQTVSGRQRLVDTICAQAIDAIDPTDSAEFEPQDLACVGRKSIISDKFVTYYLDKVLPQLSQVSELADGDRPRLELMQQLAELSSHLLSRPPGQSESSAAASLTPSWLLGGQQKSRRRIAAPNIRPSDSDELSLNSPTKRPGRDSSDAAGLTTSRKRRAVDLPVYRPPVGKFSSAVGPMPKHSSAARGGRSRYYNVYTGAGAAASATAGRRSSGSGN